MARDAIHLTGNPVFDYKAGFRRTSQSIQRILWCSGWLLIAAGLLSYAIHWSNRALQLTLHYAPLMGVALLVAAAIWAFAWRAKLRADFRKNFTSKRS